MTVTICRENIDEKILSFFQLLRVAKEVQGAERAKKDWVSIKEPIFFW
jgi:hypothetical protein